MIFLKRWFAYNKTTFGGMHELQEGEFKGRLIIPIELQILVDIPG